MSEVLAENTSGSVSAPSGDDRREMLMKILRSPGFIPGFVMFIGVLALFWDMVSYLPTLWGSEDGYYSHGYIVPLISAYIVFKNWPKIKDRPVKPQYWASIFLVAVIYFARVAAATGVYLFAGLTLLFCLLLVTYVVAGIGWVKALFFPIMYLGFALPLFTMAIDVYTNPLQMLSTKVAYSLLQIFGSNPYLDDSQTIVLDHFTLNVAVPCSGLKLMLALGAFTTFFMLVANLKWWGNLILIGQWIPLALFINGLRIALIGIVGNSYGEEAGMQFHDYSGYITLVVCFIILFRIARGLGWKD